MAPTMKQVIREFVALNERYVVGALPANALARWSDLTDVVDEEIALYEAVTGGLEPRRRGTRAPLRLPVLFFAARGVGQGETIDLSCAGCAVESPCLLPPGAKIELAVRLPGRLGTLHPRGHVRWSATDPTRRAWQTGIAFAGLADWEREALASCVLGAVAPFLAAAE